MSSSAETPRGRNQREERVGSGRPDCPICGGLGFYVPDLMPGEPGFGRAMPCNCWKAERDQDRMARALGATAESMLEGFTFDSFITRGHGWTSNEERSLQFAKRESQTYAEHPVGWLLLKGGFGCGKTHLAAAIANYRMANGHPVLFVNTADLLDHLRAAYGPDSAITYDERFEQVRSAPLLILDDLGTQSNTEWAQEKLYQIINHRYTLRLPTVITTNLDEDDFEPRIRSRLGHVGENGVVKLVTLSARDFRVGAHQSELSSLNLHADKRFDTFDLRENELPRDQAENLRRALQEAVAFAENPKGWLVFNSTTYGNGKTHLAAAIANFVSQNGDPALFVVVPDLLDYLRASFSPSANARLDRRFDEVKNAPLLVLDDLGTESATAWAREKLYQLFNYRYSARLPTVITTASSIENLDPRLATRMLDPTRCSFFVLEVPSYRGRGRRRPAGQTGRLR